MHLTGSIPFSQDYLKAHIEHTASSIGLKLTAVGDAIAFLYLSPDEAKHIASQLLKAATQVEQNMNAMKNAKL